MGHRSRDYHDYVFSGNRLVGDFEGMYRESSDVPWHQHRVCDSWFVHASLCLLTDHAPYRTALEVGCGLGYFASCLAPLCERVTGWDVSPTAVRAAGERFPNLTFETHDIRQPDIPDESFDLVAVKDLFWYVFPDLAVVIDNLYKLTAPNGFLFVFQSFPPLTSDFVGKAVLSSPDVLLLNLLAARPGATLKYSCVTQRHHVPHEGPMVAYLIEIGGR